MTPKTPTLSKFLTWSAKKAGSPRAFLGALIVVAIWILLGFVVGFTDSWLLILNTIATVNATLMVFIIQSTQTRESKALHLKIDELVRVTKEAEAELIAIEEKEEEEIEEIRKKIFTKEATSTDKKP